MEGGNLYMLIDVVWLFVVRVRIGIGILGKERKTYFMEFFSVCEVRMINI